MEPGRRRGRARVWTTITCLDLHVRYISGRTNSPGRPFLLPGSGGHLRKECCTAEEERGTAGATERLYGKDIAKRRNAKAQDAVVTTRSKLLVSTSAGPRSIMEEAVQAAIALALAQTTGSQEACLYRRYT